MSPDQFPASLENLLFHLEQVAARLAQPDGAKHLALALAAAGVGHRADRATRELPGAIHFAESANKGVFATTILATAVANASRPSSHRRGAGHKARVVLAMTARHLQREPVPGSVPGLARPERAKRASHIDPPSHQAPTCEGHSSAQTRREQLARQGSLEVYRELDDRPGISEQPRLHAPIQRAERGRKARQTAFVRLEELTRNVSSPT